jgi:predicted enzyme related to lactoylglutathione lyase
MKLSVSIDVSDLKKGEKFYIEALGLSKVKDFGENSIVLASENCDIYLQEKQAGTKPIKSDDVVRNYGRHWTPIHLDFLTKDIDEVVKRIIDHGGVHEGGQSGDWGSIAYCADPFGNGFCVINE